MTFKKCAFSSNYEKYYFNQAGGAHPIDHIYRGVPFQDGYGWVGRLMQRYGRILNPLQSYLQKKLITTGINVLKDSTKNIGLKKSLKRQLKQTTDEIKGDVISKGDIYLNQMGSGVKRSSNLDDTSLNLFVANKKKRRRKRKNVTKKIRSKNFRSKKSKSKKSKSKKSRSKKSKSKKSKSKKSKSKKSKSKRKIRSRKRNKDIFD